MLLSSQEDSMTKIIKEFKEKIIVGFFSIIVIIAVIALGSYNVKDLKEVRKAEETLNNLVELRAALEKYYQLTQSYPDLSKEGVKDNLQLLDYKDDKGKVISFAKIYGHNSIPKTSGSEVSAANNIVYDTSEFTKGNNNGGWNYDFSGKTGEIHANLPYNVYSQGINWCEY